MGPGKTCVSLPTARLKINTPQPDQARLRSVFPFAVIGVPACTARKACSDSGKRPINVNKRPWRDHPVTPPGKNAV